MESQENNGVNHDTMVNTDKTVDPPQKMDSAESESNNADAVPATATTELPETETAVLPEKMKWYETNLEMIPCKISYLLYGGVVGSYFPYLQMFLSSVGLTPAQAGFMVGLQSIITSSVDPVWGLLADRTGKRKLVLFCLCFMSAVIITPIPWITSLLQGEHYNGTSPQQNLTTAVEPIVEPIKCSFTLKSVLTALILLGAVFYSPLPGYLDGLTANVIKNSSTKSSYGVQRIWGSVSSGLSSYLVGLAADHFQVKNLSPYTPVFLFYCGVALLIIPVGSLLIGKANFDSTTSDTKSDSDDVEGKTETKSNICQLLLGMAKIPDNFVFLCTVLVSGFAFNIYVYFTLLLLAYEIPRSKAMMSLALVVECASNLVMFPLSDPLMRILGGPSQAIILALSTYAIRFIVMAYTKTFGLMIAVQALNGLSFALGWCAFIEHLHKITPKQISMTVFMLLSSVHFGVCGLVGNIAGGWVFHHLGGRVLFKGIGIICGVWAFVLMAYRALVYFQKQRRVKVASGKNTDSNAVELKISVENKSEQELDADDGNQVRSAVNVDHIPNEADAKDDLGSDNPVLESTD